MKGSKIHVAVTPKSLPIVTDLDPGNEDESRKLIPLLNNIQIRNNSGRPKSRPQCIWADPKYHTLIVLTYLYNRRIRAQIKERSNTEPKHGRPKYSSTNTTTWLYNDSNETFQMSSKLTSRYGSRRLVTRLCKFSIN